VTERPSDRSKRKILVVDDEVGFTRLLRLSLEKTGRYEVRVENDGPAALSAAREFKPELVLLDYRMPGMHGRDVAQAIRSEEAFRTTPIVFLTAMAPEDMTGVQLFLSKPVAIDEIIACIEKNLP
jgi:CheY-like chemotaxis protein